MSEAAQLLDLLSGAQAAATLYSPLDALVAEYRKQRTDIARIASYVAGETDVMHHFLAGAHKQRGVCNFTATTLSDARPAIQALDAEFWSRAMKLTDLLEYMPAAARNEWSRQIREHATPPFEPVSVRATLQTLLTNRATFFADRVEGLFFELSGQHVTNRPEGFYHRMIVGGMRTSFGALSRDRAHYVHDLRCVIAKFAGRDEPPSQLTVAALERIHASDGFGVGHDFDGGALRLRLYKAGTCHLQVHPEVARRLNIILAWRNPTAIPERFSKAPVGQAAGWALHRVLVPFSALMAVEDGCFASDGTRLTFSAPPGMPTRAFLHQLGGRQVDECTWQFAFDARPLASEVTRTGVLPTGSLH